MYSHPSLCTLDCSLVWRNVRVFIIRKPLRKWGSVCVRWWAHCMEAPCLFKGMQEVAYHWRVWSLKTSSADNSDRTQTHATILKLFCRKIYILRNKSINAEPNLSLNPSNFPKCQWKIQVPKFTTSPKEKQKKLEQQCFKKTLSSIIEKSWEMSEDWKERNGKKKD